MKKLLSIMLTVLMIVTMIPFAPLTMAADTVTLYLKNTAGWQSTMYAYCWKENDSVRPLGSWPGTLMDKVEGESQLYAIDVPADTYAIIFNDGANQTPDLFLPTDGSNCYDNSTEEWYKVELSDGIPTTVEITQENDKYYLTSYDKDGYILTGRNENACVYFYYAADIILDNVTIDYFSYAESDRPSLNITLKGENELKDALALLELNTVTIDGEEDATIKVPRIYSGYDYGGLIVNGGNVIIDNDDDTKYAYNCAEGLVVNGGSVTLNSFSTVNKPVTLNGGELNISSTNSAYGTLMHDVAIKKGAVLTLTALSEGLLEDGANITITDAGEKDSLFVRYDTTGEFVPVYDPHTAFEGKAYAEIKVDTHEHSFVQGGCVCGLPCNHVDADTDVICDVCGGSICAHDWSNKDGVCANGCGKTCAHESMEDEVCTYCGYECTHENYADGKCLVCDAKGERFGFILYDEYGDGWNENALIVSKLLDDGTFTEIDSITFYDGDEFTYYIIVPEDDIIGVSWYKGSYSEECSFEIVDSDEDLFASENCGNYEDGELLYMNCPHNFENYVCTVCGWACKHDTDNGECSLCGKYIYTIIHHPTEDEPYVEVNNDTDAAYQWYETAIEHKEIVNDGINGKVLYNSYYEEETGWNGDWTDESTAYYLLVYLVEGQTIEIIPDTDCSEMGIYDYEEKEYGDLESYLIAGEKFTYTAEAERWYYVYACSNIEKNTTVRAYTDMKVRSEIEGETSAELKNPVIGKKYACEVTYADGTNEISETLDLSYRITHQPTSDEPYVELNDDTDASYQWYEVEVVSAEITDENARPFDPAEFELPAEVFSGTVTYDAEAGWSPIIFDYAGWLLYFVADLKAGEVVSVELSSEFPMTVSLVGVTIDEEVFITVDGNRAGGVVEKDGEYALRVACDIDALISMPLAKAYFDSKVYTPVEGVAAAELADPVIGNTYACEVTFADGTTEMSDEFEYKYAITHQPTSDEPYVELNDDTDASYQWYAVEEDKTEITDENASAFSGAYAETSYSTENGWTGTYNGSEFYNERSFFEVNLNKGDKVRVEFSGNVGSLVYLYSGNDNSDYVYAEEGETVYELTAGGDDKYTLVAYALEEVVFARAYIDRSSYTKLEGQNTDTFNATELGSYACEVTFGDGTTEMSDTFEVTKLHDCDFSGEWKYDSEKHWKECTVDGCSETSEEAEHNFTDGKCACGYACPHDSYTDGVCDNCAYECPHEWGEGVLTRPERVTTTDWDDGYYTYTCSLCGHYYQETVKRADYAAYDAVSDDYYAIIMNSSVLGSVKDALKDAVDSLYQNHADVMAGDRIESEQEAVDKVVAEFEKLVSDAEEKIASDEYLKADYTAIDEAIADIEEKLASENVTDEAKAELEEIKAQLEAMKADENTSKADLAKLEKALGEYGEELDKGIEDGTLVKFSGERVFLELAEEAEKKIDEKHGEDAFYDFANANRDSFYNLYDKYFFRAAALEGGTMAENAENIEYIKKMVDELFGMAENCIDGTHNYGKGVLTRPTFGTKGYYTYTCTLCGHSYTEPTEKADTTALNDASMKVTEYIDNDTLTQEARDEIYKSYRDIQENNGNIFDELGFVRGDLVEEDQPAIDAITAELEKIIADAEEKIASGEYVKAEYTEIDEAIDDIEEKLASENVTDEGKAELEEIKKQLEEMKADKNTSAADVAELEKALDDYEEELDKGIEDGTLVEVDVDAITDDVNKKWAEKLEAEGLLDEYEDFINNQKATDEAMATMDEINDFANSLEGTVAENAENIAKLNEMLDSLLESWENCLRGTHNFKDYEITSPAKCEVNAKETSTCWFCGETDEREVEGSALEHSFTKYEETEAPKCGVAGKKTAYCDHGCGATDEKEIEALTHVFDKFVSNGDATCTADGTKTASCIHGCGTEETVTDEGTKLDHADEDGDKICDDCEAEIIDVCPDCGRPVHEDEGIPHYICIIIMFIRLVVSLVKALQGIA